MFYTLRAANVAGEPYAFEATPPPFSKKREGKASKVACKNCRTSKLRCSGDPGCCRRCSHKKLWCEYPSPPRSNTSQSNDQSSQQAPTVVTETVASDSPPRVVDVSCEIPSEMPSEMPCEIPYSNSLSDALHDFDMPDLPMPDGAACFIDDSTHEHISLEIEALWQKHHLPIPDDPHSLGPLLTEIGDLVFESPDSLPAPDTLNPSSLTGCSCPQQAMSTNESIEVTMWGQKDLSSDIYDILQQQKAMLAKCEDLLECRTCCTQPSYVMLLLCMCRKLLVTLDRTCQGPLEDLDLGALSASGSATGSDCSSETRKKRKSTYEGSVVGLDSRRNYGISIRNQQLDDDDEHSVLQSLVAIRIKMLNRILRNIDNVVSEQNWPVHKGVCQDLQASLNSGTST